jgi:predicted ATPase
VALCAAADFPDGVCFVPLASIRTPDLVASSIAQKLGLRGTLDRPLAESVAHLLRDRKLLILLDN